MILWKKVLKLKFITIIYIFLILLFVSQYFLHATSSLSVDVRNIFHQVQTSVWMDRELKLLFEGMRSETAPIIHFKQRKTKHGASYSIANSYCDTNYPGVDQPYYAFRHKLEAEFLIKVENCETIPNLAWVSISNIPNYCSSALVSTLKKWEFDFFMFTYNVFNDSSNMYPPGAEKIEVLLRNFEAIAKYDYVIFTDTTDVVLKECPTRALLATISKMERENVDMIFGAEALSWPKWAAEKISPKWIKKEYNCSSETNPPGDCYLCSGVWIGKTKKLRFYLNHILDEIKPNMNFFGENPLTSKMGYSVNSDQGLFAILHRKFYPKIKLDTETILSKRLFISTSGAPLTGKGFDMCFFAIPPISPGCTKCSEKHECI